jgi:hypothetical protein
VVSSVFPICSGAEAASLTSSSAFLIKLSVRFNPSGSEPKITEDLRPYPRSKPSAPVLAQLDTGAAWSVLNVEVARRIGLLDAQGEPLVLSTRTGKVLGKLVRAPVSLVADAGESLDLDATFFVSANWRHGTFLGYSGLLERIRFAIDPYRNLFYFGFNEGG